MNMNISDFAHGLLSEATFTEWMDTFSWSPAVNSWTAYSPYQKQKSLENRKKDKQEEKSILPLPKTEILGKQKEDSLPKTENFGFLYCRGKIILYLKNKEIVENKKKTRSPKTEIRGK